MPVLFALRAGSPFTLWLDAAKDVLFNLYPNLRIVASTQLGIHNSPLTCIRPSSRSLAFPASELKRILISFLNHLPGTSAGLSRERRPLGICRLNMRLPLVEVWVWD